MIVDKLPILERITNKTAVDRVKEHILAVFLIGDRENAQKLRSEIIECLAVIDNALEKEKRYA